MWLGWLIACGGGDGARTTGDLASEVQTVDTGEAIVWEQGTYGRAPFACDGGLGGIMPLPEEDGHRAAAVIAIDRDVEVTSVTYGLADELAFAGILCESSFAHTVEVWVENREGIPRADPDDVVRVQVPRDDADGDRIVVAELAEPLVVRSGQVVVVAVKMKYDSGDAMCLSWCDATHDPEANWWSYADAPPYAWDEAPCPGDLSVALQVRWATG